MYMSPEIANSEEYSCKVDVYALGLVLLEMVSGIVTDHERYVVFEGWKSKG